jgi:hypothetical protein
VGGVNLDALIPAHQAALLVRVSRQLVRKWTLRPTNPLRPADVAPDGRPLYRVGDVLDVERETRRSPKSHRQLAS